MGLSDLLGGDLGKALDGQFGKRLEAATTAVSALEKTVKEDMEARKELIKVTKALGAGIHALVEELSKGK